MSQTTMGVDLGGTNVRAGRVTADHLEEIRQIRIADLTTEEEVIDAMMELIGGIDREGVEAIGVGVPSMVDSERGIVYDVQNLPGWEEVALGERLQDQFGLPVHINNDTNCFALAEHRYGKGRGLETMIALNIGTGMAGGVMLGGRLYEGRNGAAGEFGTVPFRESILEHYCGGTWFDRKYSRTGQEMAARAEEGDLKALSAFNEYGRYLGFAVKMILYNYDPEAIIFGGSVARSWQWFERAMWKEIEEDFAFPKCLGNLTIDRSELEQPGVLGAALLPHRERVATGGGARP